MIFLLGVSILLSFLHLLQQSVYAYTLLKEKDSSSKIDEDQLPTVSICMAARDEEACIEIALRSLAMLDYPKDKFEIWIADDQSSDKTAEIINRYVSQYDYLHYYLVTEKFKGIRGKQNALAHVIKKSNSDLIAIVDADTEVNPKWLKELVTNLDSKTSMVCGVTAVKFQNSANAVMQHFDWVYAGVMFKAHAELSIPISGLGNNMLYRRSAYEEVGGYESMKYCLNEDFRIFHELCVKRSHGYKQVMSIPATNLAVPIESYIGAIKQRYRWMKGAKDLVIYNQFVFTLPYLSSSFVLISLFINWPIGLALIAIKLVIDSLVRLIAARRMGLPARLYCLPFWYLASVLSGMLIPLCFFYSKKITWKGRKV